MDASPKHDAATGKPLLERKPLLRATSPQLKELRQLRVAVVHPDDADGRLLVQQLQRIGCQVQALWPPQPSLPEGTDVVFLAVRPDHLQLHHPWTRGEGENPPTAIAVVNYENPTVVCAVLELQVQAILPSPIRSFGLLSTLVLARRNHKESRQQQHRIARLQAKLLGQRRVTEAKSILMQTHGIGEDQAYEMIRAQAMSRRSSVEDVAQAIVHASEILSLGKGSGRPPP
ncbi:Aliphatic amidase regulator [Delftia tsuruhatensis]|nr:ANTAR domain-containing protein [Delftia tsuruhatensis]CAB5707386.1 Aliphatic amidase regulator [Delftia tsuruhatensis]CAC9684875.1 Aliphatic amidase regulator [Delftia tsuruhatensis]